MTCSFTFSGVQDLARFCFLYEGGGSDVGWACWTAGDVARVADAPAEASGETVVVGVTVSFVVTVVFPSALGLPTSALGVELTLFEGGASVAGLTTSETDGGDGAVVDGFSLSTISMI